MKLSKKQMTATFMTAVLAGSLMASSVAIADVNNGTGTPEEQADITNWIANTPDQISKNMAMQHINTNNLNGTRYIIQWGDTLSGISSATGISVRKLCYDNNIQNANLIFAGNVLILNREGTVPADYNPNVNPYAVAQTKVTINNGPTTVNIAVQPQAIVNNYNESDNSDHSKTIYKAVENNSSNKDQDNSQSGSSDSDQSSSKKNDKKSSSISASDIVDRLNDANKTKNLSFDEWDDEKDADELDVDSDAILKAAKKNDYDAILSEIKEALGSKAKKDLTIYIEKDDDEIHVYASANDADDNSATDDQDDKDNSSTTDDQDKSSSSKDEDKDSSDSDSSQSHDDNDSNKQADTNDQDDDTSDDE